MDASSGTPSSARLLAAGQKGEALSPEPVYGPCRAANIPGKGRGLVAEGHIPAGTLLLLEPALASGAGYGELAAALRGLVEADGGDGALLRQLLSLSCWGREPSSVEPLPEGAGGEPDDFMKRREPSKDAAEYEAAKQLFETQEESGDGTREGEDFGQRLERRLTLVARGNGFRSAVDPLGALAWHALAPKEQRALAEADPSKVPASRVWLFLRASLLNHAECANATWFTAGSVICVRSACPIPAGQEILLSYWPDIDAADAVEHGLLEGFGMRPETLGEAPELSLSEEQRKQLQELKRSPFAAASALAAAAAGGDPAAAFDDKASAVLGEALGAAEKELPKDLRAFLEPRFFQAQIILQQAAVKTARGDASGGETLQQLALARIRAALKQWQGPFSKRVLLRLLFAFKGSLRPAPAELVAAATGGASGDGATQDFAIDLAKQARLSPEAVKAELDLAVEAVFGDDALSGSVLAKCGVAE